MKKSKTEKVTQNKTVTEYFCDDCGNKIHSLSCHRSHCELCGKDLCNKCVAHSESSWGDSYEEYCTDCWEIKQIYQPKIDELEGAIEALEEQMREKCKHRKEFNEKMKSSN